MFGGNSADMCSEKFPLKLLGGWAEGLACADPWARPLIGVSVNFVVRFLNHFISLHAYLVLCFSGTLLLWCFSDASLVLCFSSTLLLWCFSGSLLLLYSASLVLLWCFSGTLLLLYSVSLVFLWYFGTLVLCFFYASLVLCLSGILVLWFSGSLAG